MKKDFCGYCGKTINGFIYGSWWDKSCGKCNKKFLREEEKEEKRMEKEKLKLEIEKLKLEIKKLII